MVKSVSRMDDLSGLNEKDGGKYVKEYILEACVDSVESAMQRLREAQTGWNSAAT